jgi:hypothetical protein
MKKFLTLAIVFAAISVFLFPAAPVHAATEYTVRITEASLNADLKYISRDFPQFTNAYYEVQEGRLGVVATGHFDGGLEKMILGIIPTVNNGQLMWTIMGVSLNDQYVPPEYLGSFNDGTISRLLNEGLILPVVSGYGRNIYFTSITLSNHTITVTFTNTGAPTGGTTASNTQPTGSTAPTGCTVRTTTELRLRADASTSSATVTVVPAGVTLTPITLQTYWVQVNYNGNQGWLYRSYLRTTGCPR